MLPEKLPGDYYECVIRGTLQVRNTEVLWPFECKTPYTAGQETLRATQFNIHSKL